MLNSNIEKIVQHIASKGFGDSTRYKTVRSIEPPKPRGKSPGWKTDRPRKRRIRYPIVKKTTTKPRKEQSESA